VPNVRPDAFVRQVGGMETVMSIRKIGYLDFLKLRGRTDSGLSAGSRLLGKDPTGDVKRLSSMATGSLRAALSPRSVSRLFLRGLS